jgi:hypothetical protein
MEIVNLNQNQLRNINLKDDGNMVIVDEHSEIVSTKRSLNNSDKPVSNESSQILNKM